MVNLTRYLWGNIDTSCASEPQRTIMRDVVCNWGFRVRSRVSEAVPISVIDWGTVGVLRLFRAAGARSRGLSARSGGDVANGYRGPVHERQNSVAHGHERSIIVQRGVLRTEQGGQLVANRRGQLIRGRAKSRTQGIVVSRGDPQLVGRPEVGPLEVRPHRRDGLINPGFVTDLRGDGLLDAPSIRRSPEDARWWTAPTKSSSSEGK